MTILRFPGQRPIVTEPLDALIERRAAEIATEMRAYFAIDRMTTDRLFKEVTKSAHRSVAQRQRFHRERVHNHGTINRRKPMPKTTAIPLSKALTVPLTECNSTQIHSHGFDPDTGTLVLRFHGKTGPTVPYHYTSTQEKYDEFLKAESKGTFFGKHIKCLDCMKVVPDAELEKAPA